MASDLPNRLSARQAWIVHSLVGLLFANLVAVLFLPWLTPYHQPQRGGPEPQFQHIRAGDLTPLFSVWTQVAARSIFERGEWPLWSNHIYCGEPFFAKPQIGVISLTTLLCALLPAQVVATWTFLLHLWIAGMAMYAWCLDVVWLGGPDRAGKISSAESVSGWPANQLAAACGGAVFMLSGLMVEHTMIGHGPIVLVACWTPLVLRAIGRALRGDRPLRSATVAGALVAVQLLAGGETMFLYNVVAGTLLGLAWLVCGRSIAAKSSAAGPSIAMPLGPAVLRLIAVGGIIGVVGFTLAAIKLMPGLELMPRTNRAGGLALADAAAPIIEFTEPALLGALTFGTQALRDARHLFAGTCVLALIGLISGWRRRETRWVACAGVLLVLAGVAIAHSQTVFGVLWSVLPLFKYQRIPQRALVLVYLGIGVLVAHGARRVLETHLLRGTIGRCIVGLLLFSVTVGESLVAIPALPPTADIRREIRANELLNHAAAEPGLFRIHVWESTDRNWGIEHVTVPLGLSNLAGWDHLWLREYLGAEGTVGRDVLPFLTASYIAQHRERFWGLMNVRFVSATHPLDRPALKLIRQFPRCPVCQPAKSAGPFLYENSDWLPRARVVHGAILVLGDVAERLDATYRLLDHPGFDPRQTVLVHVDRPVESGQTDLSQYQAVVLPSRWLTSEADRALRSVGANAVTFRVQDSARGRMFLWSDADAVATLLARMPGENEPDGPVASVAGLAGPGAEIEVYEDSRVRLRLARQRGFLVLAEKFAHFPGWTCVTSNGPRELFKANGVASAIALDGTEEWVELSYWPASFARGLWITLASLVLVPLLCWFGDRVLRV